MCAEGISHQGYRAGTIDVVQMKIKREGIIRASHKLDLMDPKRNLQHPKLGKRAFLKKATCFDSILGVVGVRFRVLRH